MAELTEINKYNIFNLTNKVPNNPLVVDRWAPDDYLANISHKLIPVRPRDDKFQLPDSDLLNTIHYYVAHQHPEHTGLFDESALLAFGYLIEHWIEEELKHDTHHIYAEAEGAEERLEQRRAKRKQASMKLNISRQTEKCKSANSKELLKSEPLDDDDDGGVETSIPQHRSSEGS